MSIAAGTRLGSYEVLAPLGAGGMGAVYRARDTKLGREVAIKVLPPEFVGDPERVARFEREAQVLASLNHPHIAQIYGLEDAGDVHALVMELVDGETLDQRIASGAIPVDEALRITRQIAAALEMAHDKGIIHRDLKPSNVALTRAGTVKVLDFGLAKLGPGTGDSNHQAVSLSPTITSPVMVTGVNVLVGTAAYIAPEAALGQVVDRRADIWALGCVLFEMLTGRRAFTGDSLIEVLGKVSHAEPAWDTLPADTPSWLRRLLRRCLEKQPSERMRDAADVRLEIEDAAAFRISPTRTARNRRERALAVAAVASLALAVGVWWRAPHVTMSREIRLEVSTPPTSDSTSFALSPDGSTVVFVGTSDGRPRLWLRSLNSEVARPLPGTEDPAYPFWSPDGHHLGFFAGGQLKRLDVTSGAIQNLTDAPAPRGGAWSRSGVIVFNPRNEGPLFRIAASGGPVAQVTQPDAGGRSGHYHPQFLPDDVHFVFYRRDPRELSGYYLGSLQSSEIVKLFDGALAIAPALLPGARLLFVRDNTLMAAQLDPVTYRPVGSPEAVAEQAGGVVAAADGTFAYRRGGSRALRQLVWVDRGGKAVGTADEVDESNPNDVALSPDGQRVAVSRSVGSNEDIWILDPLRHTRTRFTLDREVDNFPVWSPDGRAVAFNSNRKGPNDIYQKSVSSVSADEVLYASADVKAVLDWSADGRYLLYRVRRPPTGYDLWAFDLKTRVPVPVQSGSADDRDGQFSPDGRWVAYQSNESGRSEVYVQAFPSATERWQVSVDGGMQVRWRRDGRELYFIDSAGRLSAVSMHTGGTTQLSFGAPVPLFAPRVAGGLSPGFRRQQYAVSPDGERFLVDVIVDDPAPPPIMLVLNWAGAK